MRLLVIAGHGDGDSGACGCGYQEANLTRELAQLIVVEARARGIATDLAPIERNMYHFLRNGNKFDFAPYNYVLEVHFNASDSTDNSGDGRLKGSMFYISQSEKGHSVEDTILNNLYALGSVQAWDGVVVSQRQWANGLLVQETCRKQGASHGLLETCFISDRDDVNWYQSKKHDISRAVVAGIYDGFKLGNAAPAFTPYMVKVKVDDLSIRSSWGVGNPVVGCITDHGCYTIVAEGIASEDGNTWGKLKSGAGWINVMPKFCEKI